MDTEKDKEIAMLKKKLEREIKSNDELARGMDNARDVINRLSGVRRGSDHTAAVEWLETHYPSP